MLYKAVAETVECDRVHGFGIPIPFRDLLDRIRHCRRRRIDYRASIRTIFFLIRIIALY